MLYIPKTLRNSGAKREPTKAELKEASLDAEMEALLSDTSDCVETTTPGVLTTVHLSEAMVANAASLANAVKHAPETSSPTEMQVGPPNNEAALNTNHQALKDKEELLTSHTQAVEAIAKAMSQRTLLANETKAGEENPSETTAATVQTSAVCMSGSCWFPLYDSGLFSGLDDADLKEKLEDLMSGNMSSETYSSVRSQYCELSMELNLRGLWAPAFRPSITIPYIQKARTDAHLLVHRDRLVIDCHWIHTKKMKINPEPFWRPLFKNPIFSIELAEEFALRELASDYRAEKILGLTKFQQLQLQTLKGSEVIARKKSLIKHFRDKDGKLVATELQAITAVIDRWCEVQPRIRSQRDKYVAHAEARLLLEVVGTWTWRELAGLAGLILGGKPLGDKTVSDFMRNLDQRVDKSKPTPRV